MRRSVKVLFWAAIILFCWDWFSHVGSGGMTTGQYLHKLDMDFQRSITSGTNKIFHTLNTEGPFWARAGFQTPSEKIMNRL
ncbi:MAG: hypothetical protein ABH891_10290 [Candidatus Omnitrophota bacterium]